MSSCSQLPPYVLQEILDITESVNYPLKSVHRIKYTCFDVSKSLIAFGATSGGIYVFNKSICEFVQLIPNKDGAITRLSISADEKHIGFATGRGVVAAAACEPALRGARAAAGASLEHRGHEVTAMLWSGNNTLFTGDDVGRISVLQLQTFIAKTMFQSSSQTIMSLDSRICQLDVRSCMLLASTLTRCYVCDTSREQYRQIGHKPRDGEFGACFVSRESSTENSVVRDTQDFTEARRYNVVDDEAGFAVGKELQNTVIYCARPSSRLWEATVEGTVSRTHQFKQVLAKSAMKIVTVQAYSDQNVCMENLYSEEQSINFSKVYSVNSAIFSYTKDALYFLDIANVDNTVWFKTDKDVVDCRLYRDHLYLWLANGSLVNLRLMRVEKFIVKCFLDEKYELCAKYCALYTEYLLSNNITAKLHIVLGLRDKLQDNSLLKNIESLLDKIDNLKSNEATQMKSGIYVVDNTYHAQSSLLDTDEDEHEDGRFGAPPAEALQTLKDLSVTVSDKLSSSKKILKEKWDEFEGKVKHLSMEKQIVQEISLPKRIYREEESTEQIPFIFDNDIIYKESSQKAIDVHVDKSISEEDRVCKSLFQYFRLSLVGKETEQSNLISIIESCACDIHQTHRLALSLEQYCASVGALEESKFVPNYIFLSYLTVSSQKDIFLESIMNDEVLYKYFVDSCISVNVRTRRLSDAGCQCGFPLPSARMTRNPMFSELIDEFVEKQWSTQTRNQCYEICKRMPYLWRKILYLRRNEGLHNVLRILLQMLDENLLHSFLAQFTLETWERAIQLYATLHANMCLNCSRKFDHISVKETLSWDDIGALIIKSVGGRNAIELMERHADLIEAGDLTVKFYHTCLMVAMYEQHDASIAVPLVDTMYAAYEFEETRTEICGVLRAASGGRAPHTALPLAAAARSAHWGLPRPLQRALSHSDTDAPQTEHPAQFTIDNIMESSEEFENRVTDCALCGLPLQNEVLIKDGGLWVFRCGHVFHGACLDLNKIKLCPSCLPTTL